MGVFSAPKVDKWPQKSKFLVKNWPIYGISEGHFWPFWGLKSSFLEFSKVVLELFRKCLGIVFGLKGPIFGYSKSESLLWGPAEALYL